jgi:hypothetical protein
VSAEATEGFLGQVNSPTPNGLLLVRTAVYQSDETYTTVHAFQDAIDIQLAQRTSFPEKAPPKLDMALFSEPRFNPEQKGTTLASATLELLAFFHPISPPRIAQDASWIDAMLFRAGISNGSFTQPGGTSLEGAAALANLTARASLNQAGFRQYLGNNWTLTAPDISGDFGSFYNVRQKIAMDGYLMLTADQAIYPSYTAPNGAWELEVGRDEAVLVTFKRKPSLVDTGFWSITLYGEDSYLIENDLRRYALSSRDNLTYPDGSLVRDGSGTAVPFQVLIQPGGNSPPKNWTDKYDMPALFRNDVCRLGADGLTAGFQAPGTAASSPCTVSIGRTVTLTRADRWQFVSTGLGKRCSMVPTSILPSRSFRHFGKILSR